LVADCLFWIPKRHYLKHKNGKWLKLLMNMI
jgi:hypothetical protein